jgi:uncharacterized MAPEG superfamily protein
MDPAGLVRRIIEDRVPRAGRPAARTGPGALPGAAMPIALWCVLLAAFLPVLSVIPAKATGDFDNARPRDPAFWREGFRARAAGAMANGFEAFPLFAVAVLVALDRGGAPGTADALAVGFVLVRIAYVVAYWTDRPTLRSALWTAGLALSVALFTLPVWSPAA